MTFGFKRGDTGCEVFYRLPENGDKLIGSEVLVGHPPAATGTFIADLNIDGINVFGPSAQVVQIGRGKSSVDAVVDEIAATQHRKVLPDQMPDRGSYYRSDQLNFARAGVPSIYLGMPVDQLDGAGKPLPGAGRASVERFVAENYHQPSDELREDWNWIGAVKDVQLLYFAGMRLATQPNKPTFKSSDEFGKKLR